MSFLKAFLLKAWVLFVYVFLFSPILTVIFMSFVSSKYSTFPLGGMTFKWYKMASMDQNIVSAFKTSLMISITATVFATGIGMLAALGIVRGRFRGKEILNATFLSPMIIPEIITGIALLSFATILHMEGGTLLIVIAHILIGLPFVLTIVSARLYGFDRSLEEAAMDLGANEVTTFRRVTFPLILPGIIGGALLAFTVSFDNFMITYLLAGPGVTTIPIQIYSMVRFEITPKIHAVSTFIVLISMSLIFIYGRVNWKK
jgi:spermidine/putrescine transport system permease protein